MSIAHSGIQAGTQEYREKMFNLIGDRNPLEILAQTPSTLGDIVSTHSAALLRRRPFEGKWTPNEVIGHLTDSEWVDGYRLRLILGEDAPAILGTKQDLWVAALRHNEREPSELVEIFRTLRHFNLAVWRRTSPQDLQRIAQHMSAARSPWACCCDCWPVMTFHTWLKSPVTSKPFSSRSSAATLC